MTEPLVIDGHAMPCEPHSDADDPADRSEENLHFGARDTLEAIRKRYGAGYMMKALPVVAQHYAVNRDALMGVWVSHYGPGLLLEDWMSWQEAMLVFFLGRRITELAKEEHAMRTRRQKIFDVVSDSVTDLLYYDRKEDDELGVGGIEEAVAAGEITADEIVGCFADGLKFLREKEPTPR
jgi:hypothetical protein